METELRETYRALKECTDILPQIFQGYILDRKLGFKETAIKQGRKDFLLKLSALIDVTSEAIDIHSTNPDFKFWLGKLRDLITPHLANLANVPSIGANPKGVKSAQKIGGLLSVQRGTVTPDGQLHFIFYVLSTLMDNVEAATPANEAVTPVNIPETIPPPKIPNPRTTKRELTDLSAIAICLIHVFIGQPITTDNMAEISERYKKPDGTQYSPVNLYNEYLNIPETREQRLRQDPTNTLINHYKRCINWLKNNGRKTAEMAANKELQELQNRNA
jgi:hypothetical protein